MIASTPTPTTEIFAFIAVPVFKLLKFHGQTTAKL